jgi:S-adenosylhomocysteine hydrolase
MFKKIIDSYYKPVEYPALFDQMETWSKTKPLKGLRVLDASPIFRNTLVKYDALLAAGTSLSVGLSKKMPHDELIVKTIKESGLSVYSPEEVPQTWDLVLDCAAQFAFLESKYGFVELTRSGVSIYEKSEKPVFVADSSEIKKIETSLGTGESYFRAMHQLGFSSWDQKKLLVFGSGKVGMGIIMNALSLGIKTSVVTDLSLYENALLEKGMTSVVDLKNDEGVVSKIKEADYIVSATGIKNALDRPSWVLALLNSKAIFANMGVEDEYGPLISDSMVLNEKKPLNFLLEEPTHLKFIDASLALHNVLSLALLNTSGKGICDIPKALEDHILNVTRQHGEIL